MKASLLLTPLALLIATGCAQQAKTDPVADKSTETTSKTPSATAAKKDGPRVDIRHGLDSEASSIDATPKPIAISDLVAMKMPADSPKNLEDYAATRIGPFEKTTYELDAKIKSIEHKKDGDFYMVVTDKSGKQAVVEVPDPELCKGSPLQPKIAEARKALEDRFHPTDKPQIVDAPATIDGVGFYGFKGRPGSGAKGAIPRLMPGTGISFPKAGKP